MMKTLLTVFCLTVAVILCSSSRAFAVSDDFSDLNDTANPAWTHLSGYVASGGQGWDASTGQYHMTAPNNGASNFGFVGSYTGGIETDVRVTSDIVSFVDVGNPPAGPIQGGVFGVAARLNGLNGIGQLGGYAYLYEPFANSFNGELVLAKIGPGVDVRDLGASGTEGVDYVRKVTLDPNKDYTFSLSIVGNQLSGEVREVGGGLIAYQTTTDTSPSPPWTSGYSGYVAYSQGPNTGNPAGFPPTDVTWDNFVSNRIPEPGAALLFACGIGLMHIGRRRRAN